MSVVIETEKCLSQHFPGPCRKIVRVEALHKNELPAEYLAASPHLYLSHNVKEHRWLTLLSGGNEFRIISMEMVLQEDKFQELLRIVRACGDRLRQINQERKTLAEVWKGIETFVI